jgi:hypothetical protein
MNRSITVILSCLFISTSCATSNESTLPFYGNDASIGGSSGALTAGGSSGYSSGGSIVNSSGGSAGGSTGILTGGSTSTLCRVQYCPSSGSGVSCCLSTSGPCGVDFGMGCTSIPKDGG